MAKILSKTGITNGDTIEVSHITQSIDALTGVEAYDITISGSLILSGSTEMVGNATTATSASHAVNADSATTASYALSGGETVDTGSLLNNALKDEESENTITFTKGDNTTFDVTLPAIPTTFTSESPTGNSFTNTPDETGKTPMGWVDIMIDGDKYYIPVWADA